MEVEKALHDMMNNCGGEDLLRYLIKEDGYNNWKTVKLLPIVAYSPSHLDNAIVCGIAYWNGIGYNILHSEFEYESEIFQDWVDYLMEMGEYQTTSEALLDHHRAIIANDIVIKQAENTSWEEVISQVIYGTLSNNFYKATNTTNLSPQFDFLNSLMDALFDIDKNITNERKNYYKKMQFVPVKKKSGFSKDFQDEWA